MSRTVLKDDLPHVKAAFSDLGLSEIQGRRNEPQHDSRAIAATVQKW
jgi:predicted component of type VI protein secretion system